MYTPRHFANQDLEQLLRLIDVTAVATLVTAGPAGVIANTVPLLRQPGADRLWGHLARPNPQIAELRSVDEALLVFNGPHGYITPGWYRDPDLVPTWNFATVQVRGRVQVHDDVETVRDIVERLTAKHEAAFDNPWSMDKMDPDKRDRMLSAIVGFHIEMDDIQGKFKLSQNRDVEDRVRIIAGLHAIGNSELAALMREQEDRDDTGAVE